MNLIVQEIKDELAIIENVRTPDVRALARKYYQEIKVLPKENVFEICEELLITQNWEERTIAFQWAFRVKDRYERHDFRLFERWLNCYVKGWGSCDDLCTHAMGELVFQYPELIPQVKEWTASDNRWKRRAAAVTLVYSIHRGKYLEEVFEVADLLFSDQEDLVQKGYGWMLKVAGNNYREEVYDYIMKNRATMPRTSLRYAIEKFPEEMRKKAMERV